MFKGKKSTMDKKSIHIPLAEISPLWIY